MKKQELDRAAGALLMAGERAVSWWKEKKPAGWGLKKYILNPDVSCTTYREKMLARSACRWFVITHPAYAKK